MSTERPTWVVTAAFYLYVLSLPFESPERGIPIEIHTLTGAMLLAVGLFQPRVCFRAAPAAFWWYATYFAVYVVLGLTTDHVDEWLRDSAIFLQVLLLFWISTSLMRNVHVAKMALFAFASSCCVLAVLQRLGITATVAEVGNIAERVTALGQNPNTFAHNLSIGLLAVIGLTYGSNEYPKLRLFAFVPCALLGVTIMPTAARAALLTLMAGIAIMVLAHGGLMVKARNATVAVLLLAGLGYAAYRTDAMRNRLLVAADANDFALREELFPAAWAMFLEKPLAGWGPVNNRYELEKYVPRAELPYRETHNMVLELLTETGLIGAIPFLIAMLLCVRAAWRSRRGPLGVTPLAMVFTVVMARMSTAGLYTKTHWLVLALAVAAEAAAPQRIPAVLRRRPLRAQPPTARGPVDVNGGALNPAT